VQWFNRLSYFVATEVCKVTESVLVHWIVQHCGVYQTRRTVPQFMGHVNENYVDKTVNAFNTVGRYDTRQTPYLHDITRRHFNIEAVVRMRTSYRT
jgi:hypothetical protein